MQLLYFFTSTVLEELYFFTPKYLRTIGEIISMDIVQHLSKSDQHWFDLMMDCRTSGLSDNQWLKQHHIHPGTFYYHLKVLRNKACEIPEPNKSGKHTRQEVVPVSFQEPVLINESDTSGTVTDSAAIRLNIQGVTLEISNSATREIIQNTLSVLHSFC